MHCRPHRFVKLISRVSHIVKPKLCIFCPEKELLAYKVRVKDVILTDEDSDGKRHSVLENIE